MSKEEMKLDNNDILEIMNRYQSGERMDNISKDFPTSVMTINGIICYYNNRRNQVSKVLSVRYKKLIDEIKNEKQFKTHKIQRYEVKLFFGLITLNINPKT